MERNEETPPFLQLRDATVMRAGKPILMVDSFSLGEGESVALLGPNGSGKSTFVKLITREVLPLHRDESPVRFRGRPRATLAEVKACVGVVSSSMQDQISVHLRAADVVAGGLYGSLGVPPRAKDTDKARDRALASMSKIGVADLAERDIMTLSTGQARRVLIARALVHDPCVLVFDEPCTGLDPEGMYYVRSSMRALACAGKSIVLVTHYPEDIIPEIDRVVLLKEGRVHADGSKRELVSDEVMSELFNVPLRVRHEVMSSPSSLLRHSRASQRVRAATLEADSDIEAAELMEEVAGPSREEEYFSLVSTYELLYTT
ncbi:ABC transporter [Gordonibacter sp. An230]|uniref:ABC transporter ATP-binding protein n=1 Tax=Gordonibacter sp. An230 TaxID=1965592 RepID=UPI000B38DF13|nr:ATP-binding cassette domain-containing protein [Gordonibacter sp. An230]OUO92375.1 ABC transporter [Gordonibacter sp. An230]